MGRRAATDTAGPVGPDRPESRRAKRAAGQRPTARTGGRFCNLASGTGVRVAAP